AVLLDDTDVYYSACFSPDHTKVYALIHQSNNTQIYQFDLNAANPSATKTLLGPVSSFGKLKLASDGKIYFRSGTNYLGSIAYPNSPALACGFTLNSIQFASNYISRALPNVVPFIQQDTAAFVASS